jgi:hypothetical protein
MPIGYQRMDSSFTVLTIKMANYGNLAMLIVAMVCGSMDSIHMYLHPSIVILWDALALGAIAHTLSNAQQTGGIVDP